MFRGTIIEVVSGFILCRSRILKNFFFLYKKAKVRVSCTIFPAFAVVLCYFIIMRFTRMCLSQDA